MRSFVRTALVLAAALTAAACEAVPPTSTSSTFTGPTASAGGLELSVAEPSLPVSLTYSWLAEPFGIDMVTWSIRWWRWELSVPADRNPGLDTTGEDCAESQGGPVWYLASLFGSGSVTRDCTVPKNKALLVSLSSLLNDYPCPDPNFKPPPGQSLEDFLKQGAKRVEDTVNELTLTVDGQTVTNPFAYRFRTSLFYFDGDPSLATAIDPCIQGRPQPAVSDGFFVMLKPLSPGEHIVVFTAGSTGGVHTSVTYNLTIQ